MAKQILDDELWQIIEPLLPKKKRRWRYPGRKPLSDRAVLRGILFVLKTGIAWEDLPQEMGCGSGMTCWRRLHDWQKAGVWDKIHRVLLSQLRRADQIDFSRAVVDSASVRAIFGGRKQARIPRIAAKKARNTIPPIAGKVGRPLRRPASVLGDRAYDSEPHRRQLRRKIIQPFLAQRRTANGSGLGVYRWVVERTLSWLHQNRRLRIRYERRDDIHNAFLTIGCIKICWNHLANCSFC
jgi:transposase